MADTERLISTDERARGPFDATFRPIAAEFFGVCLFVFVGCLSLHSGNIAGAAIGHGFTIALLIMGMGEISGGHFNPAVTLGATLAGALSPVLAVGYVLGQVVGAVLGAAFVRATLPSSNYTSIAGGTHQLGAGVEPGWAILIEGILTTVLVFTVLMSAVNTQTQSKLAPLAIGFAVTVDIMAAGPLTGASMNPARAIGPALVASPIVEDAWKYHYIYWIGPLCGAVVSALLYRLIFANNPERWIYKYVRATKTEQPSVKIFTVDSVELNPNMNNASPQSVRERL